MPPKKKSAKATADSEIVPKKSNSASPSLSLKVGGTQFSLPIANVKQFPNTTLGSLLASFDDESVPTDLDFPGRNASIFEKIVVPFYIADGSLGKLNHLLF